MSEKNEQEQGLEMEEVGDNILGQIEVAAGVYEESPAVVQEEQPPAEAGKPAEPVQEEDEPREVDLLDILDSLNAMQDTLERVTTLFAGMMEVVAEVSTGITELSAASVTASAAAGDGKSSSSSGPVNPVVLKLAIQAAMTAVIPELSKMLRGQIAAVKTDLQAAAAEDARIVENNRKTVQEYSEHRKNITQEV